MIVQPGNRRSPTTKQDRRNAALAGPQLGLQASLAALVALLVAFVNAVHHVLNGIVRQRKQRALGIAAIVHLADSDFGHIGLQAC
jgi:hypothetical protein